MASFCGGMVKGPVSDRRAESTGEKEMQDRGGGRTGDA